MVFQRVWENFLVVLTSTCLFPVRYGVHFVYFSMWFNAVMFLLLLLFRPGRVSGFLHRHLHSRSIGSSRASRRIDGGGRTVLSLHHPRPCLPPLPRHPLRYARQTLHLWKLRRYLRLLSRALPHRRAQPGCRIWFNVRSCG